jgi:hypothetical protein
VSPDKAPEKDELLRSLDRTVAEFVAALSAGDAARARTFCASDDESRKVLTEGGYRVLGTALAAQTERVLAQTVNVTRDKKVAHELTPGQLSLDGPRSPSLRAGVPVITQSTLTLSVEGDPSPYVLRLHSVVWVDGHWRILHVKS